MSQDFDPKARPSFRQVLREHGPLLLPGVFDALSAKLAERAGFPAAVVSGYAVAATALGLPDLGLLTQTEMRDRAAASCRAVRIPLLVDADTGYGNALNVYRTVRELVEVGAAGCFLEDQVWPKKCGHLSEKKVVPREEFADKLRAAVEARQETPFFVIARTDSLAVSGLEEALARMHLARQAGADAFFIEAPTSLDQLERIAAEAPKPLVANMIEGGRTPMLSWRQLTQMGFQLVIYPLSGLFAAAAAVERAYRSLRERGSASGGVERTRFESFNEMIGVDKWRKLVERFGA